MKLVHRFMDLLLPFCSGTYEFAAGEEENDYLWLIHPVYQTWKLLGLVHRSLQRVVGFLQIHFPVEISCAHYVLDLDVRFPHNDDTVGFELLDDRACIAATAELAWEGPPVALFLPDQRDDRAAFVQAGWQTFGLEDIDALLAALASTHRR